MTAISSHLPSELPHLAFVNGTAQAALATLDKVSTVATYPSSVTYGTDGLSQAFRAVAGAIVPRPRHEGLLGADGRLRHARDAERQLGQRRLRRIDEHAQQRRDDVLQRPAQSGAAERRDGPAVLRVRPPHQRELHRRQCRHRPRRGRHHDGHRRRRERRHLRHGAEPAARRRQHDAGKQLRRTSPTRRTSGPSTRRCWTTGWA